MNMIALVDSHWGIGKNGDQLAYIPGDLRRFKDLTIDKTVIFGARTLPTFPHEKPLPCRKNILLTTKNIYVEGATVCHSVNDVLRLAPHDAFVIGGGQVYRAFEPYCDKAFITKMMTARDADTWFPNLDESPDWELFLQLPPVEEKGIPYYFATYTRRNMA